MHLLHELAFNTGCPLSFEPLEERSFGGFGTIGRSQRRGLPMYFFVVDVSLMKSTCNGCNDTRTIFLSINLLFDSSFDPGPGEVSRNEGSIRVLSVFEGEASTECQQRSCKTCPQGYSDLAEI